MNKEMEYKKILKDEVEVFRERGRRFLNRELTKAEFKGMSGGMGVYAQQDQKSFMIRLRTPSGVASLEHLKLILSYVKKYNLDKVHLTTRQAIQLHNLSIEEVCDIMKDAIDHDLFTRGGGGNYPRNVSLSPMSGVEQGEAFDVTPYALEVSNYFLGNATTYHLPRKLKVAFSSSEQDTANASVNDVGFIAVIEDGKPMFRMYLAGGMGGGPAVAIPYPELISPEDVLYCVEAMVQLFEAEGDYENKAKARTRFIPRRMGVEEFLECYRKHFAHVKETCKFDGIVPEVEEESATDHVRTATRIPQKQEGLYSLILHPQCGQLLAEDLEKIVMFMDKTPKADARVSMEEDLYIRNLTLQQMDELWALVGAHMMDTPLKMTLSCVGVPSCQMGILQSQKLCREIISAVEEAQLADVGLPQIHISGCPNSCSRHQVAEIGFAGRKVKVEGVMEDAFTLQVGGATAKEGAHMGEVKGVMLAREIPKFIAETGRLLKECGQAFTQVMETEEFEKLVQKYVVA